MSMLSRGVRPQCIEEACWRVISLSNSNFLKHGVCVHTPIIKCNLAHHLYLNNNLLSLYAKCFPLNIARQFFDEMPYKDVVSWTGIISAYNKNEKHVEALELFTSMNFSGVCPNSFTFSNVLKSCYALGEFRFGECLHSLVIKHGFESNQVLGCNLIGLYSKFGSVNDAFTVFSGNMSGVDVVSWTTMISSFLEDEKWSEALKLYESMIEAGVCPSEFTYVKVLAACSFLGLKFGKLVHAHMIVLGVQLNIVVKTALVDLYSKCRRVEDAVKVSNLTPEYDVMLWTAIVSGLAQNSKFKEAVVVFRNMEMNGISPNNVTYTSILNVCSSILSLYLGKQIHTRVVTGGLQGDVSISNALVDMYGKCSSSADYGLRVFRGLNSPNVVSWTSLIAGFSEHGFQEEAFDLFTNMRATEQEPNSYTLSVILRACSMAKSSCEASKLHGYIIKIKLDDDITVTNALVDAYAGSGKVDDAWHVMRHMKARDAITYTGLAARLNQTGKHELALSIINHMFNDDVKIDEYSLASFLSASSSVGSIERGLQLHCLALKSGLDRFLSVSNALVVLYGKCGPGSDADKAFAEITEADTVSWNSLISCLASKGSSSSALSAFDDMRLAGVKPDSVTFSSVLSACSHGGLVDLSLEYFRSMRTVHFLEPQMDHYVNVVDMLGRAGRLEEAMQFIETMPLRPNALLYRTLLAACRIHRNLTLGEDVARRGLDLNPSDRSLYSLLAKLYDDCKRPGLGDETRKLMREMTGRSHSESRTVNFVPTELFDSPSRQIALSQNFARLQ